MSCFA